MIESITMHTQEHSTETDFWSDVYCGRPIAILNLAAYTSTSTTSCSTTSSSRTEEKRLRG